MIQEEIKAIRMAAKISAIHIAEGKKSIRTEYGRKTQKGVANMFLHQMEIYFDLKPGDLQINV